MIKDIAPSKDVLTLYSNLALAQAWLCNYDELKHHSNYHKHRLKQVMQMATTELEKHVGTLQDRMFMDGEEVFQAMIGSIEYLVNLMATCPASELIAIVQQIKTHQETIANAPPIDMSEVFYLVKAITRGGEFHAIILLSEKEQEPTRLSINMYKEYFNVQKKEIIEISANQIYKTEYDMMREEGVTIINHKTQQNEHSTKGI